MKNNTPKIYISIAYASSSRHLGKSFSIVDGEIVKEHPHTPSRGTIQQLEMSLRELHGYLVSTPSNSALLLGHVLEDTRFKVEDGTKFINFDTRDRRNNTTISRTKDCIGFTKKPGLFVVDYDPVQGSESLTPSLLHEKLCSVHSGFKGAGYVAKYSSSSGLLNIHGELFNTSYGFHLYYFVRDSSIIPNFVEKLYAACWQAGQGFIKVSKSGAKLDRVKLFDRAAIDCARLVFEAEPKLLGELERKVFPVELVEGGYLNTNLSNIDLGLSLRMILKAKERPEIQSLSISKSNAYKQALSKKYGNERADQIFDAQNSGCIFNDREGVLKRNVPIPLTRKGFKVGSTISLKDALEYSINCPIIFEDFINNRSDKDLYFYPKSKTIKTFAYGGGSYQVVEGSPLIKRGVVSADGGCCALNSDSSLETNDTDNEERDDHPLVRSALMSCIPIMMTEGDVRKCVYAVHHSFRTSDEGLRLVKEWAKGSEFEYKVIEYWEQANTNTPDRRVTFGTLKQLAGEFGWNEMENVGPVRVVADRDNFESCDLTKVSLKHFSNHVFKRTEKGDLCLDEQDALAHAAACKYVKHVFVGAVDHTTLSNFIHGCLPKSNYHEVSRYVLSAEVRQRKAAERLVTFGEEASSLGKTFIESFEEIIVDYERKYSLFVRAPMGAGKTEWCAQNVVHPVLERGGRVLVITHRERLSRSNAVSYSPYTEYDEEETELRVLDYKNEWVKKLARNTPERVQAVSLCVNSLTIDLWQNWIGEGVDCVIVDEASQVLDHIAGWKKNGRVAMWRELICVLNQSQLNVLMDASLSDNDLKQLAKDPIISVKVEQKPVLGSVEIYELPIQSLPVERQFRDLNILPNEGKVLSQISDCCNLIAKGDSTGRFMFACDSSTLPWVVLEKAVECGVSKERVLVITSDKGQNANRNTQRMKKQAAAFVAIPDEEAHKYDIVAFSPAIDSGISLKQTPPHFHHMFGVFQGVSAAPSCLQQLRRLRTVNCATVYLDPGRSVKGEADIEEHNQRSELVGLSVADTAWFDAFYTERTKRLNDMHSNQGATIAAIAPHLGFTVNPVNTPTEALASLLQEEYSPESDSLMRFCSDINAGLKEEHIGAVLNAKPIDRQTVQKLQREELSTSDRLSIQRYYVSETLGLPFDFELNEEQIVKGMSKAFRRSILNAELAFGIRLPEDKTADIMRPVSIRKLEEKRTELAQSIFAVACSYMEKYGPFIHKDLPWVMAMFDRLWEDRKEFALFGLVPNSWTRPNCTKPKDPVSPILKALKRIGLSFTRRKINSEEVNSLVDAQKGTDFAIFTNNTAKSGSALRGQKVYRLDKLKVSTLLTILRNREYLRMKSGDIDVGLAPEMPECFQGGVANHYRRSIRVGEGSENVTADDVALVTGKLLHENLNQRKAL